MKVLLILFAAPALFAQGLTTNPQYETKLGTETVEFQGGVMYRHGDHETEKMFGARVLGGLNRFLSGYGEYAYSRSLTSGSSSSGR